MAMLRRGSRRVFTTCLIVSLLGVAAAGTDDGVLASLRLELIPAAGTETAYGMPLSLTSLPQFIGWWDNYGDTCRCCQFLS